MPMIKDKDGRGGWKNPGKSEVAEEPKEEAPKRKGSRRKKAEEEYD